MAITCAYIVAPDAPPTSVNTTLIDESTVEVNYEGPPSELSNGEVISYDVQYCPCDPDGCTAQEQIIHSEGTAAITVEGMVRQTFYCFRAAALTVGGRGPWSQWIRVITTIAGKHKN